jgi:hypothetical protein
MRRGNMPPGGKPVLGGRLPGARHACLPFGGPGGVLTGPGAARDCAALTRIALLRLAQHHHNRGDLDAVACVTDRPPR